jgi:nucleoside triphosphate pyrophosphatase
MTTSPSLLLASASPRRRQILQLLGLPFTVAALQVDEDAEQQRFQGPSDELAQWLAKHKAAAALKLPEADGRLVITADTTVLLDGQILGKPKDEAHARALLLSLRGRWHHVVTGIAVSNKLDGKHKIQAASCITPVLMRAYSKAEIDAYIASADPMDKAGAYGIQNPAFQPTARIDGCYLNVVGLPLCVLVELLADFDVYPSAAIQRQVNRESACPWSEKCRI